MSFLSSLATRGNMRPANVVASWRTLQQTQAAFQQHTHAGINYPVEDIVAQTPRVKYPSIHKPLKLIGHRLRLHRRHPRQVRHAEFPGLDQRVQQP